MPVSIVIGGQYGSESKGKVGLEIVRRSAAVRAIVRVGGTNSGHIAYDRNGIKRTLRQLPASCIDGGVKVILPPGSYINLDIFFKEIEELQLTSDDVLISPMARIITQEHIDCETKGSLNASIGSTQSGTGACVLAMTACNDSRIELKSPQAKNIPELNSYTKLDTTHYMRDLLKANYRIVIEGTQGFGLCVTHGGHWPMATSRGTTAGQFLAEAGLSPKDADDITLVIRCHPIRVAGNSGPLPNEIDWKSLNKQAGLPEDHNELTTVTKRVRRIAKFDAEVVKQAIMINQPTRIVLNHLDYIDPKVSNGILTNKARKFVKKIESEIGQKVDWVGVSPEKIINFR
jgi:adenylosuccinate synthase